MTARERLDAEFIQSASPQVAASETQQPAANAPERDDGERPKDEASTNVARAPDEPKVVGDDPPQVVMEEQKEAAQKEPEEPEPPMTGSCDRMWALVAMKPKTESEQASTKEGATSKEECFRPARPAAKPMPRSARYGCGATSPCTRIPPRGKPKANEASGEAIYLDNRGTNNALTYIYQRDPTERTYLPGPLPPARVENAEINIAAAGKIGMDQGADLAWVEGPGTLTQLTDRGFLTDKSGDPDEPEPGPEAKDGQMTRAGLADSTITVRTTAFVNADDVQANAPVAEEKPAATKPKTRAGKPQSNKVPMTINFSERMNFVGRSVDPQGRRAARIDFYGIVTAAYGRRFAARRGADDRVYGSGGSARPARRDVKGEKEAWGAWR